MNKSLYPLMLSDRVVQAIDALAAQSGTNRSNMVNQILADYVSYITPEKRMEQVFGEMEHLLTGRDSFQVLLRGNSSILNMRSALTYKYNPNVRYSVELYRGGEAAFGELRVTMRTKNHSLLLYIMQFFKLWMRIESSYVPGCQYAVSDGRFTRKLMLRMDMEVTGEELGRMLSDYVGAFDGALKAFFYHLDEPQQAVAQVERCYREYYQSCGPRL